MSYSHSDIEIQVEDEDGYHTLVSSQHLPRGVRDTLRRENSGLEDYIEAREEWIQENGGPPENYRRPGVNELSPLPSVYSMAVEYVSRQIWHAVNFQDWDELEDIPYMDSSTTGYFRRSMKRAFNENEGKERDQEVMNVLEEVTASDLDIDSFRDDVCIREVLTPGASLQVHRG